MKPLLKVTILSLSLLTIITGAAVAPSLSVIHGHFSTVDPLYIKLIITLPGLVLIPFSILSGKLAERVSKKNIIIVGLALYILGGMGGAVSKNFIQLMIMRVILGSGIGLIAPQSTGLIADFYVGKERQRLMGLSVAVNNLGAVAAILISGALSTINWRWIFMIYAIGILVLILVILFLKDPDMPRNKGKSNGDVQKKKLIGIAIRVLVLQIAFGAVSTNLSLFMKASNLGSSTMTSIMLSVFTISPFLAGLLYGYFAQLTDMKKKTIPLFLIFIGFVLLSTSHQLYWIGIGIFLIGYGTGSLMPTHMLEATSAVSKEKASFSLAIITSCMFFGQFLSPLLSSTIQLVLSYESIRMPFYVSSVAILSLILDQGIQHRYRSGEKRL